MVASVAVFAPSAAAETVEACRDGQTRSAMAIDDDIRIVDNEGWYYVSTASGGASVWQETNDVPGLQTEQRTCHVSERHGSNWTPLYSYVLWEADTLLGSGKVGLGGASLYACVCIQ